MIEFMEAFPDVNYRYYFQPSVVLLPSTKMLDFDPVASAKFIEMGAEEAKEVIELGPGVSFKNLKNKRDQLFRY